MTKRYRIEFEYHDLPGFWVDRGFHFYQMGSDYTARVVCKNDKVRKGRILDTWQGDKVVFTC